jgi:hypothetical protein
MHRLAIGAGGLVLSIVLAAIATQERGQDSKPPKAEPPATKTPATPSLSLVPDKDWHPEPGDTATIVYPNSPGARSNFDYRQYMKAAKAKDEVGKRELLSRKAVVLIPEGTSVLVIKRYRPDEVAAPSQIMSGDEYRRALQQAVAVPEDAPSEIYPLEVRITDGPHKGLAVFVPEPHVQRLIPKPPPAPPKDAKAAAKPKPVPKPVDPAVRTESLIRQAKSLEASNPKAAVAYYRQVVKDYPMTPAAKTATQRLKELGASPP